MKYIKEVILGIIALLAGALFFFKRKADNAEALNQNLETKEKVLAIDQELIQVDVQLALEKAQREELEKKMNEVNKDAKDLQDIADLINNSKSNK